MTTPTSTTADRGPIDWMLIGRIAFAVLGVSGLAYGIVRLLTEIPLSSLVLVGLWLIGAVIIHDALLAPAVVGLGWALRRFVPDRERRYLQAYLIIVGLITVIAVPMIHLQGTFPPVKALLRQNYGLNLLLLAGATLIVTAMVYLSRRSGRPGRWRRPTGRRRPPVADADGG